MFHKFLIACTVLVGSVAAVELAGATTPTNRTGMSRQEIKSMDILERPNRPGHFYGNTVRRLNGRKN